MAQLNDALLAHLMSNASAARRAACLEPLNAAMARYVPIAHTVAAIVRLRSRNPSIVVTPSPR